MDNSKEFQTMLDGAIRVEPNNFKDFDRTKNVQDQLQEMVGLKLREFCFICDTDDIKMVWPYPNGNTICTGKSMEQLWLAFVMKEKYNKVWDGENWIINDK